MTLLFEYTYVFGSDWESTGLELCPNDRSFYLKLGEVQMLPSSYQLVNDVWKVLRIVVVV